MEHKTFGEWLRHRRLAQGISPFLMADALGYKRVSAIYNFEYGVAPLPISKWPAMARLLKMELDEFLVIMNRFAPHKVAEFRAIQKSGGSVFTEARPELRLATRPMTVHLETETALHRYRLADADLVLVSSQVPTDRLIESVDTLRAERQWKVGFLEILMGHPFPGPLVVEALRQARTVCVIETHGAAEALSARVKAAFVDALTEAQGFPRVHYVPKIFEVSWVNSVRDFSVQDAYDILRQIQAEGSERYLRAGTAQVAEIR